MLWNRSRGNDYQPTLVAIAKGLGPGWTLLPALRGDSQSKTKTKPEYIYDFHLAADFPIAGRIVDAGGKPVAGAVVVVDCIYPIADPHWQPILAAIKSGDASRFHREVSNQANWFNPVYPTVWRTIPTATTDMEGRFQVAGVGRDRAIRLEVTGPAIRTAFVFVLTRDDVADFTQAFRVKYPRTREPDGYFYPPRKNASHEDSGDLFFGPSPTIEVDPARTIAGVVRDASTGEPIGGARVMFGAAITDRYGRYCILRTEDNASIAVCVQSESYPERFLPVERRFTHAQGLGETVADFDVPRGVGINGRVIESGTDRPIVSGRPSNCDGLGPLFAGNVFYFPLSTNTALRGAATGLYFEGFPTGTANYDVSHAIGGDGRFRIAVPPGPGVLLVQSSPGLPPMARFGIWKESEGLHRLFPYVALAARAKHDGAPEGDRQSFPGFNGPIWLSRKDYAYQYHAYRVINPPADATTLDVTLTVPRAPSRVLRFVDPDGRAIRGVRVYGLVAPPLKMTVVFDGSEAEVLALEPGMPREVIATSNDAAYAIRTIVSTDDPQPRTIRLKPTASVSGRLLDVSTGLPLAGYSAFLNYPLSDVFYGLSPWWLGTKVTTDANGRFQIRGPRDDSRLRRVDLVRGTGPARKPVCPAQTILGRVTAKPRPTSPGGAPPRRCPSQALRQREVTETAGELMAHSRLIGYMS